MASLKDIKEQFELSASLVRGLKKKPTDQELLSLYGLYKQGTEGDCTTEQPSFLYVKERAKWGAWQEKKGVKKSKAMEEYTNLVLKFAEKYGLAE